MKNDPKVRLCRMIAEKQEKSAAPLPFLTCIVYLEVYCTVTICIVSLLGISMGHSTEHLLLLALVQLLITLPALVNMYKKLSLLITIYAVLQGLAGICELLYIIDTHKMAHGIEKSMCLGVLGVIQILATLVAVICPEKVFCQRKKKRNDSGAMSPDAPHFPEPTYGMPSSRENIAVIDSDRPNSAPAAMVTAKKKKKKPKKNVHFSINQDDSIRTRARKSRFNQSLDSLKNTVDEKSKRKRAAMRKMKNLQKQQSSEQMAAEAEQQKPKVTTPQEIPPKVVEPATTKENESKSDGSSLGSTIERQRSEASLILYGDLAGHTPVNSPKPKHIDPKFLRDGEVLVSPSIPVSTTK